MKREKILLLTLAVSLLAFAGCGNGNASEPESPVDLRVPGSSEVIQVRLDSDGGDWVAVDPSTSKPIPFEQGIAVFGDAVIVRKPGEAPEIHRQPVKIMSEISATPHLYLKDGTLEEVLVLGNQGNPIADPETRSVLCWLAATCDNPPCAGQSRGDRPYVFPDIQHGARLDPQGNVDMSEFDWSRPSAAPRCPACGVNEYVRVYVPPDAESRKSELMDELKAVRSAIATARSAKW